MIKPRIILRERSRAWAPALARRLPGDFCLRQTRGLGAAAAELDEAPTSLLALELTRQDFTGVLALVSEIGHKFSRARVIILAERGLDDYEWLFREAGAVYFTSSPRELPGLADLVRRHFRRLPTLPAASLAAQVWDTLPWNDRAIA
jgi:hypothetical protein